MEEKDKCQAVWSVGLFVIGCSRGINHDGLHLAVVSDKLDKPKDKKWATIVWGD